MYRALRTFLLPGAQCWDAGSKRSYQDLFERLDTNKDGKVDVAELRAGLKAMGIFRHGAAQVQIQRPGGSWEFQGLAYLHDIPLVCLRVRVRVCVRLQHRDHQVNN